MMEVNPGEIWVEQGNYTDESMTHGKTQRLIRIRYLRNVFIYLIKLYFYQRLLRLNSREYIHSHIKKVIYHLQPFSSINTAE